MSFKNVYNALYTQLVNDTTISAYVNSSMIQKGFKENIPNQEYALILEPGNETEESGSRVTTVKSDKSALELITYSIDIYARVILLGTRISGNIVGTPSKKGVLEFVDDIKAGIKADRTLGYNRQGSSVSSVNPGTNFTLDATHKYISVKIYDRTPVGYDIIECGTTILTGDQVAANIQTALRALGNHTDDGYYDATCVFNNTTRQFTISSRKQEPDSCVVVTAGASDDCSSLLGFDNPSEVCGRNIVKITFGSVTTDNTLYPVRYRVVPVEITEEILI